MYGKLGIVANPQNPAQAARITATCIALKLTIT